MGARTLLASAARTTSSNAAVTGDFSNVRAALFVLSVTAAAADAGDTLDVYVQHTWDEATTYDDLLHFTQVLGNGGVKTYLAQWRRDVSPESELRAPADAGLAAGVLQGGPVGDALRIKWVIVDSGDADQSFTFSVSALFEYDH